MGNKKYAINENVFLNEDDVSYYLLGAYMSDGCVYSMPKERVIEIASTDIDWLIKIRNIISPTRPLMKTSRDNLKKMRFASDNVFNWLNKNECVPKKSRTLKMPDIPEKYLPDFVRGYFDGDGSVTITSSKAKRKNKTYIYPKLGCYICSGSKIFIESLHEILNNIEIKSSFIEIKQKTSIIRGKKIKSNGNIYRVSFSDQSAIKFINWTHYDGHKLSMPRKFKKIQEARKIFSKRPGLKWNYKTK